MYHLRVLFLKQFIGMHVQIMVLMKSAYKMYAMRKQAHTEMQLNIARKFIQNL